MKIRRLTVATMIAILIALTLCHAHQVFDVAADEKLLERQVEVTFNNSTTTEALIWTLKAASLPGGIEMITQCDEPVRHWLPTVGSSLRNILESIVTADPQYKWEVRDGVINLVSLSKKPSLLAVHIAKFEITKPVTIDEALEQLLKIPEVQKRADELNIGPRLLRGRLGHFDPSTGTTKTKNQKKFSVRCENVTLREALNVLARTHGQAMWVYTLGQCRDSNWFEVSFSNQ